MRNSKSEFKVHDIIIDDSILVEVYSGNEVGLERRLIETDFRG